jgi:hypothetical protein
MTSRLAQRSIFLVFILAFAHVVSGFPPPPKATARLAEAASGREGDNRNVSVVATDFSPTGAATHAPSSPHDDGVWQSARQLATTNGVSFRIGKHDLRTATIAPPRTLTAVRSELTDGFGSDTRDRSPQHSIPLLI